MGILIVPEALLLSGHAWYCTVYTYIWTYNKMFMEVRHLAVTIRITLFVISTFKTRSEKLITNCMSFNRRDTFMDWVWHHTETTDLAVLPCNSLDTYWLLCTTTDGQLTSRFRLEHLHIYIYIVSQSRVRILSGHTSSSQSTTVLDICMVGWTGAEHELTVGLVCASTHPCRLGHNIQ